MERLTGFQPLSLQEAFIRRELNIDEVRKIHDLLIFLPYIYPLNSIVPIKHQSYPLYKNGDRDPSHGRNIPAA